MLFKIDENLSDDIAEQLRNRGHDAMSVFDQGLQGSTDQNISVVCRAENRALITLDLDFANVIEFPPQDYPGLIVLRLANQSRAYVSAMFVKVLDLLDKEALQGSLWIVEESRVRIRRASDPQP
jgi:predicted nuclease of predicted toxin-antitoxin system